MTELERALKKEYSYNDTFCKTAHIAKYNAYCGDKPCEECEMFKNGKEILKILLSEHKEKPKLTDDEKAILRNVEPKFKYIARDKNRVLFIYIIKPYKDKARWKSDASCLSIDIFGHLFQSIKWEDDEPYNIEELLKEVE